MNGTPRIGVLVAVADERHFTRAAARMHVSQSGLSAAIKTLEAELHATLFERTTRRVRLTAAGAALLPDARRALAAARAGADAVNAVQGLHAATCRSESCSRWASSSCRESSRVTTAATRTSSCAAQACDGLHHLLVEGDLDLCVASRLNAPTTGSPSSTCCTHRSCSRVAPTTPTRPEGRSRFEISPTQHHRVSPRLAMRNLTDRATAAAAVSLDVSLEVNDTATLLDLVEAGLGVTLIADALTRQRRSLRTVPLSGGPKIDWTVSALTLARHPAIRPPTRSGNSSPQAAPGR